MRRIALAFLVVLLFSGAAMAERRVALVFGADDYEAVRPLENAVNDARAIEKALEALGFEVTLETDRDLRRMRRALEDFREDSGGADVALVYFAGHGVEIGGENRLLPVDADATSVGKLKASSLPLEEITETVRAIAPIAIVLLDACRNDPFGAASVDGRGAKAIAAADAPEVMAGLGRIGRAENVLFAFAAAPGKTASDGADGHSPFAAALAEHLGAEGVQVGSALKLVQQDVYDRTRGAQLPFIEDGLPQMFFAAAQGELPEREQLLLAMADISFDVRDQVEQIASDADVPLAPLYAALIGSDGAKLSAEERGKRLAETAEQFIKVRDELRTLGAADPQVKALRDDAEQQLALGAIDTARARLAEAATVDEASRETLKTNYFERTLSQAATQYLSGRMARASLSHEDAVADFDKALALYAEVPAESTPDGDLRRRMLTLDGLGDTWKVLGNLTKADAAFTAFRDIAVSRVDADPSALDRQHDLAVAQHRIGDLRMVQGRTKEALEAHEAGLAVTTRIVAADPMNVSANYDLAVGHEKVGDVWIAQGDLDGALTHYLQALATFERLASLDPDNIALQRALRIERDKVAHIQLEQGKLSDSLSSFDKALADAEELLAKDPNDVGIRNNLAALQDRIGDARRKQGDLAAARTAYEAALAIREKLIEADPANTGRQRDLSISYERMGDLARAQGDAATAISWYERLLSARERLATSDPANAEWQADLAIAYDRIGDANIARDELDRAATALEASLSIRERLASADADNRDRQRSLAISNEKIGNLHVKRKDLAAALTRYKAAVAIQERLVAAAPAHEEHQRDLSVYIERVADIQVEQGDVQSAHASYTRVLAIREKLTAEEPGNADWQRDMIISLVKLAGMGDEPLSRYERALSIAVGMRDAGRLSPDDAWMVEALQAMVDQAKQARAQ